MIYFRKRFSCNDGFCRNLQSMKIVVHSRSLCFNKSFNRHELGVLNLGVRCKNWFIWVFEVGQKNDSYCSVLRKRTPPKNYFLRLRLGNTAFNRGDRSNFFDSCACSEKSTFKILQATLKIFHTTFFKKLLYIVSLQNSSGMFTITRR